MNITARKMDVLLSRILFITAFTFLIAASTFIKVPLYPVPFTLQTLFVLLAANILGKRDGTTSQILYISVGLAGLPIFALGGGPAYVLQPSFGYILGFVPAAYVIGTMVQNIDYSNIKKAVGRLLFANFLGLLIIYIAGLSYLYINVTFIAGHSLSLYQIVFNGFILFIPAMIVKLAAASFITVWFKR